MSCVAFYIFKTPNDDIMGAKPSFITVQCPTVGMQPIDDPELSRDTCVLSAAGLWVNSFNFGQ